MSSRQTGDPFLNRSKFRTNPVQSSGGCFEILWASYSGAVVPTAPGERSRKGARAVVDVKLEGQISAGRIRLLRAAAAMLESIAPQSSAKDRVFYSRVLKQLDRACTYFRNNNPHAKPPISRRLLAKIAKNPTRTTVRNAIRSVEKSKSLSVFQDVTDYSWLYNSKNEFNAAEIKRGAAKFYKKWFQTNRKYLSVVESCIVIINRELQDPSVHIPIDLQALHHEICFEDERKPTPATLRHRVITNLFGAYGYSKITEGGVRQYLRRFEKRMSNN